MKTFKFLLIIILCLAALESGLQIKAYIKHSNSPVQASSHRHNVLLIGDSLLGNADEPISLFSQLAKNLEKSGSNVNLIDASIKANYSAQANFNADELLQRYNPELSIVLLGGSDFINAKLDTSSPLVNSVNYFKNFFFKTYLYKLGISIGLQLKNSYLKNVHIPTEPAEETGQLVNSNEARMAQTTMYQLFLKNELDCEKTSRLARLTARFEKENALKVIIAAKDCANKMPADDNQSRVLLEIGKAYRALNDRANARTYLNQSIVHSKNPDEAYSILYWIAFDKFECPAMFVNFEKILETAEPHRRMLWNLRNCFVDNNKNAEGAEYFIRLAPKLSETKNLSILLSQSLMPEYVDILKTISPGDNYYYGSKLQEYRSKKDKIRANELFLNRNFYAETDLYKIDLKNYRELLNKLTKDNKKVIVLQYPNQPDWPVLEAIAPLEGNISFVSLSSIFEKQLDTYSIYELLTEDLTHLSTEGAAAIAAELTKEINKTINQGKL